MSDPLAYVGLANFLTTLPSIAERPSESDRQTAQGIAESRRGAFERERSQNGTEAARNGEAWPERSAQSPIVSRPLNTVVLQSDIRADIQEDPAASANPPQVLTPQVLAPQVLTDVPPRQAINADPALQDRDLAPQTIGVEAFSSVSAPNPLIARDRAEDSATEPREPVSDEPRVQSPETVGGFPLDIAAVVEEDADFDPESEIPAPRTIPGGPFEATDPQPVAVDASDDSGAETIGLSGNDPIAEAAANPELVEERNIVEAGVFTQLPAGETALAGQPAVLTENPATLEDARLVAALRNPATARDGAVSAQAGLTAPTPDGAGAGIPEELTGVAGAFGVNGGDPAGIAARIGSSDPEESFAAGAGAIAAPVAPQNSAAVTASVNPDPEEGFGLTGNDPLAGDESSAVPQAVILQRDDDRAALDAARAARADQNQVPDILIRPTLQGQTEPLSETTAEAIGVFAPPLEAEEVAVVPAGGGLTAATDRPFGDPVERFAPFAEPGDAGATLNAGDALDREQLFTSPNGGVPLVSGQAEFDAARNLLADDPDPIELFNDADGVGRIAATTSGSRLTNEGVAENSENVVTAADPEELIAGLLIDETEFNREVDLEQTPINPADLQQIQALGLDPEENPLVAEELTGPAATPVAVESAQAPESASQRVVETDPEEFFLDGTRPESIVAFDPDPAEFAEAALLGAPLVGASTGERPDRSGTALDPAERPVSNEPISDGFVSEGFVNTQVEPDTAEAIDAVDAAVIGDVPQSTQTPNNPQLTDFAGQDIRRSDPIVARTPGGIVDIDTQLRDQAAAVTRANDVTSTVTGTISAGNPIAVDIGPDAEIRVVDATVVSETPTFDGPPQPVSGGEPSAFTQVGETLRATTFIGVQSAGTVDSFV